MKLSSAQEVPALGESPSWVSNSHTIVILSFLHRAQNQLKADEQMENSIMSSMPQLKKKTLIRVLLTSCKCHKVLSHKGHVQSAILQHHWHAYYVPLLLCYVASWLADVSWWTQRKTQQLTLAVITTAKSVLLFLSGSNIAPGHTYTPLRTSACVWLSHSGKTMDPCQPSAGQDWWWQCILGTIVCNTRTKQYEIWNILYSFRRQQQTIWMWWNYNQEQDDQNAWA